MLARQHIFLFLAAIPLLSGVRGAPSAPKELTTSRSWLDSVRDIFKQSPALPPGTPPVTPLAPIDGGNPEAGDGVQATVFFSENDDDDQDEDSDTNVDVRLDNTAADLRENEVDFVVEHGVDVHGSEAIPVCPSTIATVNPLRWALAVAAAAAAYIGNLIAFIVGRRRRVARASTDCGGGGGSGGSGGSGGDSRRSFFSSVGRAIGRGLSSLAARLRSIWGRENSNNDGRDFNFGSVPEGAQGKASRWLALAQRFVLRDLRPNDVLPGDSDHADRLQRDRSRMSLTDSSIVTEQWVVTLLLRFITELPVIGYNQGMGQAAIAVGKALQGNADASFRVLASWAAPAYSLIMGTNNGARCNRVKAMEYAWTVIGRNTPAVRAWIEKEKCNNDRLGLEDCDKGDVGDLLFAHIFCRAMTSMCTLLGFQDAIQEVIIDATMQAGLEGPAVSIWMMCAVLNLMEQASKGDGDARSWNLCNLKPFCLKINTFAQLQAAAPVPLEDFVKGYAKALKAA